MQVLLGVVSNIGSVADFNFGLTKEKRVPRVTYISSSPISITNEEHFIININLIKKGTSTVIVHGRKLVFRKYETTIIMVYDSK